jgi:lysozyme
MTPSCRAFLYKHVARAEGYSEVIYPDSKGIATIGIGHNVEARPLSGEFLAYFNQYGRLSKELVYKLLDIDLAGAISDARKLFPRIDSFTESRQVALYDLVYNMGYTKLNVQFQPTIAHVNAGEWEQVASHLEKTAWYGQVGKRGPRVVALLRFG